MIPLSLAFTLAMLSLNVALYLTGRKTSTFMGRI